MRTVSSSVAAVLVTGVLGIFVPVSGLAQSASKPGRPPPASVVVPPFVESGRVMYDAPGDGSLWAIGRGFKISFDAGVVTYYPYFGGRAPRSYSLALRLASVTAPAPAPVRSGDRVSFDHGAVIEIWNLSAEAAEQTFRFDRPVPAGDLVVRLAVATDLTAGEDASALHFGCEYGSVRYGRAVVLDAGGRRADAATRFDRGAIEIRVDAAFVASSTPPLTIDPVITTLPVSVTADDTFSPDVAFNGNTGNFLAVWERAFSATDHDVYSQLIDFNGVLQSGTGIWLDVTSANWTAPRVAGLSSVPRFLAVAQSGLPGAPQTIVGRTRDAVGPAIGPVFTISGLEPGDKVNPDVGGDPLYAAPSYWCVVWERVFAPGDHDIHARLVSAGSTLLGTSYIPLADGSDDDRFPAVSNSDGGTPVATQRWTAVWQRDAGGENDIWGAQLAWNGAIVLPAFPMQTSVVDTRFPSVSTVTDAAIGHRYDLVAFEAAAAPNLYDTGFLIMEGTALVAGTLSLSALEGVLLEDRSLPVADSDGCTFTIAYAERFAGNPADYDIFATSLAIGGGTTAVITEARAVLATTSALEDHAAIASSFSGGGPGLRHLVLWDVSSATYDIRGAAYDAHAPGSGLTIVPTGCQGLNLAVGGFPAIGQTMSFNLTNATVPSLLAFGFPIPPATFCGFCALGLDTYSAIIFPVPAVSVLITCDGFLVGLQVAVQGADLGGSFCNALRVSDTAIVTIL